MQVQTPLKKRKHLHIERIDDILTTVSLGYISLWSATMPWCMFDITLKDSPSVDLVGPQTRLNPWIAQPPLPVSQINRNAIIELR